MKVIFCIVMLFVVNLYAQCMQNEYSYEINGKSIESSNVIECGDGAVKSSKGICIDNELIEAIKESSKKQKAFIVTVKRNIDSHMKELIDIIGNAVKRVLEDDCCQQVTIEFVKH